MSGTKPSRFKAQIDNHALSIYRYDDTLTNIANLGGFVIMLV